MISKRVTRERELVMYVRDEFRKLARKSCFEVGIKII